MSASWSLSQSELSYQQRHDRAFDSVVIISPYFWNFQDDMWQTTHHIAEEFARLCPTVLVEPPVQWNFRAEQFRARGWLRSIVGPRTEFAGENLAVFHRRGLPFGRYPAVRDFVVGRNARALREYLQTLGFRRTLLWHSFPYWSKPVMEAVDYSLFAYHCLDFSACEEEETGLIRRADAVFCVSDTLVERHRALNSRVYLLPNGVNSGIFDADHAANSPRPADLPARGRLLGFLGSINCHLDMELLLEVANAFSNDHLILIGRILENESAPRGRHKEALEKLQSRGNVRILGFKPTRQLAAYLHACDVCLIPFLANRFNRECDPLKFYQYSAMGKPVVTTRVSLTQRYGNLCYLADSHREFVECIHRALNEGDPERRRQERMALARAHSWEALVAQACGRLQEIAAARAMVREQMA